MSLLAANETSKRFPSVPIELLFGFGTVFGDMAFLFAVETAAGPVSEPLPLNIPVVPVTGSSVVPPVVSPIPSSIPTSRPRSSRSPVVVSTVRITLVTLSRIRFLHSDLMPRDISPVLFQRRFCVTRILKFDETENRIFLFY